MLKIFEDQKIQSNFYLADSIDIKKALDLSKNHFRIIWNRDDKAIDIYIDNNEISVLPQELICVTHLHKISIVYDKQLVNLVMLSFNKQFYCIHTNDNEVSCNGLLFFGSDYSPVIRLDTDEKQRFNTIINVLMDEFETVDQNQEEMLRLLLKRFIIRCTRLARKQLLKNNIPNNQLKIVRMFNVLVEEHYKSLKQVADYAKLLNRSPKTINNIFGLQIGKTPLQIIHDRIILEAKRFLLYTDKSSKEIAFELGFEDPSQFSKFFKNNVGKTPQNFKETT